MERNLRLKSRFFKGHGHGNDYLVFEEGEAWPVTEGSVQVICHRQRGIGGDGIVAVLSPLPGQAAADEEGEEGRRAPFRLRMFNPDGSEFERSGNGLRIFGAYLYSVGKAGIGEPIEVEVGGDKLTVEVLRRGEGGILEVSVDMGKARLGPGAVEADPNLLRSAATAPSGSSQAEGWVLGGPDGSPLSVYPVSVGNPHCVVFRTGLLDSEFRELGPFLTGHPAFGNGTNVQVGRVVSPREVEILIWERGVGRTSSSGTSACAAAAAGVGAGLLYPGAIRVGMEGGSFTVTVSAELSVTLEGPVQPLLFGELDPGFLENLRF